MDFKELIVYKNAFNLAMEVYEVSKSLSKENHSQMLQESAEIGRLLIL